MQEVKLIIIDTNITDVDKLLKKSHLTFVDEKITNEIVLREAKASFYLKRKYIGDYEIGENGKPLSKKTYFNISHSHGVVVLVINKKHPIGVDIELIRDMEDHFVRYVCNDEEIESSMDNDEQFFKIWTNKESLLKCGLGIRMKMNDISGLPLEGERIYQDKTYYSKRISYEDYVISITLENEDFNITQ